MEDQKEKLTKEELIEKINNERRAFSELHERMKEAKDKEAAAAVVAVRRVADQVISRFIRSFGQEKDGEYVLDIPVPDCPDGHFWGTKIEIVDEHTWRLHCKLYDIPKMK